MNNWLILASILLGLTAAQGSTIPITPVFVFGSCSYTGDPHVIPFPSSPGQITNMYWCQTPGWEIVLQNKWVFIAVLVGPNPYVILDYVVFFFNADGSLACVLIGSAGYSTCLSGSPITSTINPGGASWNHFYPLAEDFNLQITSYPWLSATRYDFNIRETFALINQSTGVCVKNNCPLESTLPHPHPIFTTVCNIYIAAAQKQAIGRVDEKTVNFIRLGCLNDLTLSFNIQFAQTVVAHIIYKALDSLSNDEYQGALIKAPQNIATATLQANREAADAIANQNTCFEQKRCLT